MPGNEIIFNMMNHQFFRNGELVSCLYEFSKRLQLPENQEFKENDWDKHPYVGKTFKMILQKLPSFNVRLYN
jgi:hypothetical protein